MVRIWDTILNVLRMERLDLRRVACALVEFCVRKIFRLEIPEFGGDFKLAGYFDEILIFQRTGRTFALLA